MEVQRNHRSKKTEMVKKSKIKAKRKDKDENTAYI